MEQSVKPRAFLVPALALALAIPHTPVLAANDDANARENSSLFSLDRGRLLVQKGDMEFRWDLDSPAAWFSYDGRTEQLAVEAIDFKRLSVLADKTLIVVDSKSVVGTEAAEVCAAESQAVTDAMTAVAVMCQQPNTLGCLEARGILAEAASDYSDCVVRFYQKER